MTRIPHPLIGAFYYCVFAAYAFVYVIFTYVHVYCVYACGIDLPAFLEWEYCSLGQHPEEMPKSQVKMSSIHPSAYKELVTFHSYKMQHEENKKDEEAGFHVWTSEYLKICLYYLHNLTAPHHTVPESS